MADLPLERLRRLSFWLPLKAFLVIAGTVSGYATAIAGFLSRESFAVGAWERWIQVHTIAGIFTLVIATIISLSYLAAIRLRTRPDVAGSLIRRLAWVAESRAMFLGALTILLAVFLTSAIGRIIAFDPNTDSLARIVYMLHVSSVHFPIALLTAYGVADLPLERLRRLSFWFPLKAFLVIAGTVSGYATAIAGFLSRESFPAGGALEPWTVSGYATAIAGLLSRESFPAGGTLERWVDIHTIAGIFTLVIATIISLSYLAAIRLRTRPDAAGSLVRRLAWLAESRVVFLAGLTILLAVLLTGAIGRIIAFGPDTDSLTRIVYRWLK